MMTWEKLVRMEPRLQELYEKAGNISESNPGMCPHRIWAGPLGLREALSQLVGCDAEDHRLARWESYSLAAEKIFKALPACSCRQCSGNGCSCEKAVLKESIELR